MAENKRPQNDQKPNQENEFAREIEVEVPKGVELEVETEAPEQKDARGGNHNPKGANQYTSGRVDDRGRKE